MGSCLCKPSVTLMGAAGWCSPELFFICWVFFCSSFPRLTREHLLKDKIKKPMAVYIEDSVFAFASRWRESLCYCQQINKIRALF